MVSIVSHNLVVQKAGTGTQILTNVRNLARANTGVMLEGIVEMMDSVQGDHVGHTLPVHLVGGVHLVDVTGPVIKNGEKMVAAETPVFAKVVIIVYQNQTAQKGGGIMLPMNVASLAASRLEAQIRALKDSSVMGGIVDQTENVRLS